jgi:hypothetical protein
MLLTYQYADADDTMILRQSSFNPTSASCTNSSDGRFSYRPSELIDELLLLRSQAQRPSSLSTPPFTPGLVSAEIFTFSTNDT